MSDNSEEKLEEAFLILVKLAQRMDERSVKFSSNKLDAKKNAIDDAQMRNAENKEPQSGS